ncbi:ORF V: Enzymatic polyprotein [Labeo rohita]|uniref:ORF V: Enzymatic polyprotein n=1 Tax=Labeo rohita TaxID=84645 RepID=A0ABQ8MMF9_LABRO|nr:ORF V: Enzymatic polyprotein [Labeo rohita]
MLCVYYSGSTYHAFYKIRCLSVVLRICESFAIILISPYSVYVDNDPKHTARVDFRQLSECPRVAQPQLRLEPNQIFLEKPKNVRLPPSNLTELENSIRADGGSALRCHTHPYERAVVKAAKKSVLSPVQRTTYLGMVWDSTVMQEYLSSTRTESILTAIKRVKLFQSFTLKQFQRLLGLMSATSNVIPFGLLYLRPLQWCRCLRALDIRRKPWSLSQGLVLGAPCHHVMLTTNVSHTGWGADMSGHSAQGLWESCHLSWHINCLEMQAIFCPIKPFLPDLRGHHVLVCTDNIGGLLHQPLGGSVFTPPIQPGVPDPSVGPGKTLFFESSLHPWVPQSESRHPVEARAKARGIEAPTRGGGPELEGVWSGLSGFLCLLRDLTLSSLVLPHTYSSSGTGCCGTDVDEAASVHISPNFSAPKSSGASAPGQGLSSFKQQTVQNWQCFWHTRLVSFAFDVLTNIKLGRQAKVVEVWLKGVSPKSTQSHQTFCTCQLQKQDVWAPEARSAVKYMAG